MSFASFSNSFKYFHTADTLAALVCNRQSWIIVIQEKDRNFIRINGAALM